MNASDGQISPLFATILRCSGPATKVFSCFATHKVESEHSDGLKCWDDSDIVLLPPRLQVLCSMELREPSVTSAFLEAAQTAFSSCMRYDATVVGGRPGPDHPDGVNCSHVVVYMLSDPKSIAKPAPSVPGLSNSKNVGSIPEMMSELSLVRCRVTACTIDHVAPTNIFRGAATSIVAGRKTRATSADACGHAPKRLSSSDTTSS
eukprot:SAG31_NODE_1208_length_9381_cov_49.003232_5_plen_205_part_00